MPNKWKKDGEFKRERKFDGYDNFQVHTVTYWNQQFNGLVGKGCITAITINGYADGNIQLRVHDPKNKLAGIRGFHASMGFWIYTAMLSDSDVIEKLLFEIDKIEPLEEIKEEIFFIIKKPAEEICKEILDLAQKKQFEEAIILANKYQAAGYEDAMWMLAKYFNENEYFQEVFDVYKAIPDTNPHFVEANINVVHFIYSTLDAVSKGQFTLSEVEIITYREEQFRFALKAGAKIQTITDQIYHALCGEKGLVPKIKNVQGDADTLIQTAKEIHKLRTKLKNLTAIQASPAKTTPAFFSANQLGGMVTNELSLKPL